MPAPTDKVRKMRFMRAVGLTLRIFSGTFSILMAGYILWKMSEGMTFFQGYRMMFGFFIGGPTLYLIGLVIHRKYKKALAAEQDQPRPPA